MLVNVSEWKNKKIDIKLVEKDQVPGKNQADFIFFRFNILWQEATEPYLEDS